MRDEYLRGALSRMPTARQVDVLATFIVARGSVAEAAARAWASGRARRSDTWQTSALGPALPPSS